MPRVDGILPARCGPVSESPASILGLEQALHPPDWSPGPFLVWSSEAPALISLGISSPRCIPHGSVGHAPRPEVPGPVILRRVPLCPLPRAHTFLGAQVRLLLFPAASFDSPAGRASPPFSTSPGFAKSWTSCYATV